MQVFLQTPLGLGGNCDQNAQQLPGRGTGTAQFPVEDAVPVRRTTKSKILLQVAIHPCPGFDVSPSFHTLIHRSVDCKITNCPVISWIRSLVVVVCFGSALVGGFVCLCWQDIYLQPLTLRTPAMTAAPRVQTRF